MCTPVTLNMWQFCNVIYWRGYFSVDHYQRYHQYLIYQYIVFLIIPSWRSSVPVLCFLHPLQKLAANECYKSRLRKSGDNYPDFATRVQILWEACFLPHCGTQVDALPILRGKLLLTGVGISITMPVVQGKSCFRVQHWFARVHWVSLDRWVEFVWSYVHQADWPKK